MCLKIIIIIILLLLLLVHILLFLYFWFLTRGLCLFSCLLINICLLILGFIYFKASAQHWRFHVTSCESIRNFMGVVHVVWRRWKWNFFVSRHLTYLLLVFTYQRIKYNRHKLFCPYLVFNVSLFLRRKNRFQLLL